MTKVQKKNYKKYFVYLLACADNTLYCGSTSDLPKRLHAHNHLKSAAKYTRSRRPVTLAYSEQLKTFAKMRAREAEIKRMTRSEKLRLIAKMIQVSIHHFRQNK